MKYNLSIGVKKMTVIERAIESAKNRKYKLEEDLSYDISDKHRKKAEGQKEVMQVTIDALEKQIPKKPNLDQKDGNGNVVERCPNCLSFGILDYCMRCGQAIDWSEEDV